MNYNLFEVSFDFVKTFVRVYNKQQALDKLEI